MKIDPIHFFNERGASVLSMDHLTAVNAQLEAEVAELKRRNRSLTMRLKAIADADSAASLHS